MTAAPSRRAALAMALAVMPTAAAPTPPPALLRALANPVLRTDATTLDPAGPDAEMIRRLDVYLAATVAYNTSPSAVFDCLEDPLWQAVVAAEADVDALPPQTLAGILAKARAALVLVGQEPNPEGGWEASQASDFAKAITFDLLRLFGAGGEA